jgi:hypothetical protein
MYGMPDSVIATSTRKAIRMAKRVNKSNSETTPWGKTVQRWLSKREAKKLEQFRLERLERKHKVKFS